MFVFVLIVVVFFVIFKVCSFAVYLFVYACIYGVSILWLRSTYWTQVPS